MVDEEKVDELVKKFGYDYNYLMQELSIDELNHATSTYFLIDQMKEF